MVKPESRIQNPEARKNPDNQSVSLSATPRGGELVTHIAEAAGLGAYSGWPKGLKNLLPIYDMLEKEGGVSLEQFLATVRRLRSQGKTYGLGLRPARAAQRASSSSTSTDTRGRGQVAMAPGEGQGAQGVVFGGLGADMPYAEGCRVPEHLWANDDANGWRDVPDKAE
jgi:hypothetical protein